MSLTTDLHSSPAVLIPPGLAETAAGRDFITTAEFARAINWTAGSVRKALCLRGHVLGIRPRKFGSRVAWPVADIARFMSGEGDE